MRLEAFESRIRALEGWWAEKAGEERRLSTVSAGAGGIVGGVVAVQVKVKVLGGGEGDRHHAGGSERVQCGE